ncbi:MAG: molybdopterin molybdotransferase MoeA [Deltaproteobacteria bacterium]|nr:molybdopterin molybdotransferase MoeA [Deltaproteobacteria bacterium]
MLTFDQAIARVLEQSPRLGPERVTLSQARGRILAENIHAIEDMPAFDYSAMDGYALASAEASAPGASLRVTSESRAGGETLLPLAKGQCARIFTGARVPAGADAVEMQENVTRTEEIALFAQPVRAGQNIRRRGEDLAKGALALQKGTRLTPSRLSLLAALGRVRVQVSRAPVVTVLSTGDELREAEDPAREGSVIECIAVGVAALAAQCGAIVRIAPIVRDQREQVTEAVRLALEGSDLVVTVGGVSVGDHDLVRGCLTEAGVTLDFWRVALKPGKPLCLGHRGPQRVLGLPGNPASALLTFALFGAPMLRAMQGDLAPRPMPLRAHPARTVTHALGRQEFVRVTLDTSVQPPVASPLAGQASGSVLSMAWADALMVLPADRKEFLPEESLEIIRMSDV